MYIFIIFLLELLVDTIELNNYKITVVELYSCIVILCCLNSHDTFRIFV